MDFYDFSEPVARADSLQKLLADTAVASELLDETYGESLQQYLLSRKFSGDRETREEIYRRFLLQVQGFEGNEPVFLNFLCDAADGYLREKGNFLDSFDFLTPKESRATSLRVFFSLEKAAVDKVLVGFSAPVNDGVATSKVPVASGTGASHTPTSAKSSGSTIDPGRRVPVASNSINAPQPVISESLRKSFVPSEVTAGKQRKRGVYLFAGLLFFCVLSYVVYFAYQDFASSANAYSSTPEKATVFLFCSLCTRQL